MNIRFCEFCSNVLREESANCPVCGAQPVQQVTEEQFNDPANPWPFEPLDNLVLRIQGQPRVIRFSGTNSIYHFWTLLHREYDAMRLCCRIRKDEMELVGFSEEERPDDFKPLDPALILNCRHRKFSFYTYQESDPEIALEPGEMEMTYQGSFEVEDCPPKSWGNVLGWLVATAPRLSSGNDWTYDI